MTWTLNGEPAPRHPGNGWLLVDGVQYPADWPKADLEALGLVWTDPAPPSPSVAKSLKALADRRWWKTQDMPSYDGATDVPAESARSVVTSKVLAAQFLTDEQKQERHAFKLKTGEWRQWNVADLVAYGLAIGAYVQACFDREEVLEAEIRAAEDPSSVDTSTGWPE